MVRFFHLRMLRNIGLLVSPAIYVTWVRFFLTTCETLVRFFHLLLTKHGYGSSTRYLRNVSFSILLLRRLIRFFHPSVTNIGTFLSPSCYEHWCVSSTHYLRNIGMFFHAPVMKQWYVFSTGLLRNIGTFLPPVGDETYRQLLGY